MTIIIFLNRGTKLNAYREQDKELREAVRRWLPVREKTIKETNEVAEKLQKNHRKANISRIVGSGISIVGTALVVIGSALIPSTMGGSLAFFILGIVTSSLGEAIAAGALIAEIAVEKWKIREIKKKRNEDQRQLEDIQEKIKEMKIVLKSMSLPAGRGDKISTIIRDILCSYVERFKAGISGLKNILNVAESAKIEILQFCYLAFRIGCAVAKGSSIVLNVLALPVNIREIMKSSSNLESRFSTNAINNQLKHASHLEREMEDAKKDTKELLKEASNLLK